MNSMSYIGQSYLQLSSRNEGKIKSYESCCDVRAWSHDCQRRDRYLREWIKCDMPICILPTSTLAKIMRTMTRRSRCKATPRCHPDCKSKVVLDSIYSSCHAMKECFKNQDDFEKYFDDEEFETSNWPCERCLEALKSIKMFWKIIIEKIFNVNMAKTEDLVQHECSRTDSVRSVAKVWQTEIVQQAMFVRSITPFLSRTPAFRNSGVLKGTKTVKRETLSQKPCILDESNKTQYTIKSYKVKSTDTDCLSNPKVCRSCRSCSSHSRRISRQCSARINVVDNECNTCKELLEDINTYKINLEYLQDKFNCKKKEAEKLKKENSSLKIELQNVYKTSPWKTAFYKPVTCACSTNSDAIALLPKPFECCAEENKDINKVKSIDSEMIITMKNCQNEAYRHISLLQVLHKSNEPICEDLNFDSACCRREDPIELLTKVHNTFGEIVKREMGIANDRISCEKKSDIDASFHKLNTSKSAPSCSTIGSSCGSTDSNCDLLPQDS